jgi:hypothetical protein
MRIRSRISELLNLFLVHTYRSLLCSNVIGALVLEVPKVGVDLVEAGLEAVYVRLQLR